MSQARLDERPSYRYQDSSSGSDSDSQCHDQDSKLTYRSSLLVPSPHGQKLRTAWPLSMRIVDPKGL